MEEMDQWNKAEFVTSQNQIPQLEVVGGRCDYRNERKIDFNYKKNSEVAFTIDGQKTKMFPVDDRAWTESTKTDKLIVKAMKRGKKLVVTGTSSPGNLIKDTYSLIGFTKALSIIDKTCSQIND